ncbi:MAG: DUF1987 domain-containing protein [Bacteroidales bacterium]
MNPLIINSGEDTPTIYLDNRKGKMEFSGSSVPENAIRFYKPVIEWLDQYVQNPKEVTEFVFRMKLLNTSSSKVFYDIFKIINKLGENCKNRVRILWYYSYLDDEIREQGHDYKGSVNVPFELVLFDEH